MIQIEQQIIEVFKTNLTDEAEAQFLKDALQLHYPDSDINFDLDDCDNILRIEGTGLDSFKIERFVEKLGYRISVLPD